MPKCRWTDGPRTDHVEPIMVVFESKEEKDELWTKLSMKVVDDIVKKRSSIAITNVSVRRCVGKYVLDIYTAAGLQPAEESCDRAELPAVRPDWAGRGEEDRRGEADVSQQTQAADCRGPGRGQQPH